MKLGFARMDITPNEPTPLAGYGNAQNRYSNNVLSKLYATCMVLTDEQENSVVMIQNDLVGIGGWFYDDVRRNMSELLGVPFENILIHATHNHSSPDITYGESDAIQRYRQLIKEVMPEVAKRAMENRKLVTSAEMAKTKTRGLNFVRHYVLEDGHYKGDNFGEFYDSPYQGHTTEADPEMRLIKFHRVGAPDLVLCNWQSHPHRTGGTRKYDISSDIVGVMRDEMEEKLGCDFIYFTGGAGNINPTSRIPEENITKNYVEQGQALARHALDAENAYTPLALDTIRVVTKTCWEPLNRPDPAILDTCLMIRDFWLKTNDSPASKKLSNQYGINSQYAALYLIGRINSKVEGYNYPFTAVSFGDWAFVQVPYEMFDTHAKYVRDNSPFAQTIVASCCNDTMGYIPSAYAFSHGCYEADATRAPIGAGERFAYAMVRMLRELK